VRIRQKSDRWWDGAWRFRSQLGNARGGAKESRVDLIQRLISLDFLPGEICYFESAI